MTEFPCIICQNGDSWSGIICDDCEEIHSRMEDIHNEIYSMICVFNKIYGSSSLELGSEIDRCASLICNQIYHVKISYKEINGRNELLKND